MRMFLAIALTTTGVFAIAPSFATPSDPTIVAVGDIARYVNGPQTETARLATALAPREVLLLGDLAYTKGSDSEFRDKFAANWGTVASAFTTIAVPGNHEYGTNNAGGYRHAATTYHFPTTGSDLWSVTRIGTWTVIGLDSEGIGASTSRLNPKGKREIAFLKNALATNAGRPTIVMWHRPRYSNGQHGNQSDVGVKQLWKTSVADSDVKLVLWGHDHDFEPVTRSIAATTSTPAHSVLSMTIGTGGAEPYTCTGAHCLTGKYGVVKLTLHSSSVDWQFRAVSTTKSTGTILKSGTFGW